MKTLRNRRGQMVIEMVLMMLVFLGATYFVSNQFRSNNMIASLVSGPWKNLAGMIQNGVWMPSKDGMPYHPNARSRWVTPVGEEIK